MKWLSSCYTFVPCAQWKAKHPTLLGILAIGRNQWLLPNLESGLGWGCNEHLHSLLVKFPVSGTCMKMLQRLYSDYCCYRLQRAHWCSLSTAQHYSPLALILKLLPTPVAAVSDCLPVHSPWNPWGSHSFADIIQGMSGQWSQRVFFMCVLTGLESPSRSQVVL